MVNLNMCLIREFGKPQILSWVLVILEPPQPNKIQIRITAIGVNFIDIHLRKGLLPTSGTFPPGIGVEGIGEVVAIGSEATEFKIGDKVACSGVTTERDFENAVKEATNGKGVDVLYDSVGMTTLEGSIKCVKPRGTLVLFGNSSGKVSNFDPALLGSQGSIYLTRPSIAHYCGDPIDLKTGTNAVFTAIRNQHFKIRNINRYTVSDALKAHQDIENSLTMASTILTTEHNSNNTRSCQP